MRSRGRMRRFSGAGLARKIAGRSLAAALALATAAGASAQIEPLPLARTLAGSQFEVTVKRGDSLRSLGSRYGIDPPVLAELNGLGSNARLVTGQTLRVDNRAILHRST